MCHSFSPRGGEGADPLFDTTEYGQGAGGTHPTRKHSCFFDVFVMRYSSQSFNWDHGVTKGADSVADPGGCRGDHSPPQAL